MYNAAIIGAGQLGSRHLQGLKLASSPLSITVMDSNDESLNVAKERYGLISPIGEKNINYVNSIDKLPSELDLVIIATGSKPRAAIVRTLLNHAKVKYLVLEKVLFPSLTDYNIVSRLLKDKGVRCWVNCPRRMFGMYKQIKEAIDTTKTVYMTKADEDWGLCCNAIHMIDLFLYLTEETTYSIETRFLNDKIEDSKRGGYIEMTGTLKVITPKGNELTLISEKDFEGEKAFMIQNNHNMYVISEGGGKWSLNGNTYHYSMPYQSQLSGLLADEILITGGCSLTSFDLSACYHKPFIEAILAKYNDIKGYPDNKILPIT
ncbi:MAG: Gfo/Idh/MocA family oxidoreductase [Aeriscardovia sp.]|nr:Gfo/Idh/MocA family oxidoreductase [Aeriscardovia sp.]